MGYMSKEKFEKAIEKIRRDNKSKARKLLLKEEKSKYATKIKLPSTSKVVLWAAFAICIEVLIFCEVAFIMTKDTSFLYVLAGIPATLVPTIISYYSKSKSENTVGGIVYETAIQETEG